MKMKCKCGSENVTILNVQHYSYRNDVIQHILRCWDCDCAKSLLDKWWEDEQTWLGDIPE